MENKLKKFREDIKKFTAVVFCVKCGSTHIDQNFKNQLRCYNCGNKIETWDGDKFSIVRAHGAKEPIYELTDVKNLFRRIENKREDNSN